MKLRDIATLLNAEIEGNDSTEILRVAKIEDAVQGDVTFIANPRYNKYAGMTKASALIVGKDFSMGADGVAVPALLRVQDPYASFLKVLVTFNPPDDPQPRGIHPTAVIASTTSLGKDVRVGAHVVIGEQCAVGDGTIISHNAVVGNGVRIGSHSLIYPNVSIREGCVIGSRVILQPGVVIGGDGFGFAPLPDGTYEKIPQLGIVVIEDDVEIGANTTVDRATLGETRIKKGAKLDNLIMVAHNVVIGENTVIAGQAGISGSTKIGAGSMIGGQVGLTGHLQIAENTKLGAQCGVHRSINTPGMTFFGTPAHPHREAFRMQAAVTQLPDLINTIRQLQKRIEELESRLSVASKVESRDTDPSTRP